MTYQTADISIQDANPIEAYRFRADDINFYFTNSPLGYVLGTDTYVPVQISRSQPRVNQDEPGSQLEIKMSLADSNAAAFVDSWIATAPEVSKWRLTLTRIQVDDTGFIIFWIGNIVSVRYENNGLDVIILCKSLNNMFTLQGPRKNWGTLCNHRLFGDECTVNRNSFTVLTSVASIDAAGLIYTMTSVPAPSVRWEGGYIIKPGTGLESRLIVDRSGNDITLQYPIAEIGVNDSVQLSEGCNHDSIDCKAYNNLINYGGTLYTPFQNPFTRRLDL